jgi:hypothetical protein
MLVSIFYKYERRQMGVRCQLQDAALHTYLPGSGETVL